MSWFHLHHWKVNGAQQMYWIRPDGKVHTPMTEVLLVCECGEVKTIDLDGHWELKQLQGDGLKKPVSDHDFLGRLGIKT